MSAQATTDRGGGRAPVHALASDEWQMAPGERAAIEGLLAQIRPTLAIELGTAQGGSLARIAEYSREVHTFDLEPSVDQSRFSNVTFHVGDSHVLLAELLAEFARQRRNVDFVLVDGDHRPAGARKDLEDLLRSPALRQSTVVMHDTMNEGVRAGFAAVDWATYPSARFVDLSFVQLEQSAVGLGERWGGLGLILVDADGTSACRTGVVARREGAPGHVLEIVWRLLTPLRAVRRRLVHRGKDFLARL